MQLVTKLGETVGWDLSVDALRPDFMTNHKETKFKLQVYGQCRFTTCAGNQMSLLAASMGLGSSCLVRQPSARQAEATPDKKNRPVAWARPDDKHVPWF